MCGEASREGFFVNGIFYVYEHWRPDLDVCFYVGKGKGTRAFKFRDRNAAYGQIANGLAALGMCVEVRMVASGLSESDAFTIERERIKIWRSLGVDLANRTDGGEGFSGFVRPYGIRMSDETKKRVSAARKGMKFTAEHRLRLAQRKIGVKRAAFKQSTIEKMQSAAALREARKRARFGNNVTRWSRLKETVE